MLTVCTSATNLTISNAQLPDMHTVRPFVLHALHTRMVLNGPISTYSHLTCPCIAGVCQWWLRWPLSLISWYNKTRSTHHVSLTNSLKLISFTGSLSCDFTSLLKTPYPGTHTRGFLQQANQAVSRSIAIKTVKSSMATSPRMINYGTNNFSNAKRLGNKRPDNNNTIENNIKELSNPKR